MLQSPHLAATGENGTNGAQTTKVVCALGSKRVDASQAPRLVFFLLYISSNVFFYRYNYTCYKLQLGRA